MGFMFFLLQHLISAFYDLHAEPPDRSIESVTRILATLRGTTHNGFPVWARQTDVEADDEDVLEIGEDGERRLKGMILRSQLLVLLQRRHFVDADGQPVSVYYLTVCVASLIHDLSL